MGREARVFAEIGEWSGEGKLLLELDEIIFRGARRHVIPLADITTLNEQDGWLTVMANGVEARFDLGAYAAKWLHAIRNPRTRIDKFDVKSATAIALVDVPDEAFVAEVMERAPGAARGSVGEVVSASLIVEVDHAARDARYDLILFGAAEPEALQSIPLLRDAMKNSGGLWVIHPKGRADLSHDAIMAVAAPLGLIDVKSARFDTDNAALKLMLPRRAR